MTEAWYRLGNHLSLRRDSEEAIAAWREVLRVDPDHEWTGPGNRMVSQKGQ